MNQREIPMRRIFSFLNVIHFSTVRSLSRFALINQSIHNKPAVLSSLHCKIYGSFKSSLLKWKMRKYMKKNKKHLHSKVLCGLVRYTALGLAGKINTFP